MHLRRWDDAAFAIGEFACGGGVFDNAYRVATIKTAARSRTLATPLTDPYFLALSSCELRIPPMPDDDVVSRLKAALSDRYAIERELGAGRDPLG